MRCRIISLCFLMRRSLPKRLIMVCGGVIILMVAACSIQSVEPQLATAVSTAILLPTPTNPSGLAPTPAVTPEPTNSPSATPTLVTATVEQEQTQEPSLKPIVTASSLRFDSWSPDSQWLAYWAGSATETGSASLAFFNVLSGENCSQTDLIAEDMMSGGVRWQAEDQVIVRLNEANEAIGIPCHTFTPLNNQRFTGSTITYSPNRENYAETSYDASQGQVISYTVTIRNTTTDETVTAFSWEASIYLSGSEPDWLNNELYLIGQTAWEQGVLYLSIVDGQPHNLLTDLMGLTTFDNETVWLVFHKSDPITGAYHILLQWQGAPTYENWSPLLLYHSELNLLEELTFYKVRPFDDYGPLGFSQDGHWLLIGSPVEGGDPANDAGRDYWLRPVDPPNSEAMELPGLGSIRGLSPDGKWVARLQDGKFIHLLTFPEGEDVNQWEVSGYHGDRLWWSPDSRFLVVWGAALDNGQESLFLVEP